MVRVVEAHLSGVDTSTFRRSLIPALRDLTGTAQADLPAGSPVAVGTVDGDYASRFGGVGPVFKTLKCCFQITLGGSNSRPSRCLDGTLCQLS